MSMQSPLFAAYRLILIGGILLSLILLVITWRRRTVSGAIPLVVAFLASVWWALCYVLPLPDPRTSERFLRFRLAFAGIVLVTPAILAFTLQYTGRKNRFDWHFIALLAVEPAIGLLAVWWPALHDLFFGDWRGRPEDGRFKGGALFWAHTLYSYTLIIITYGLLVRHYLRESALYRRQIQLVFLGIAIPGVFNVISVARVLPPNMDITPLGIAICNIFLAKAIFKHGLLNLIPIARDKIIEAMSDGILVVDASGRVVDSNPAIHRILKREGRPMRGRQLRNVLPQWTGAPDDDKAGAEIFIAGINKYIDVRPIALKDAVGTPRGSVLVLRDITAEKTTALALEHANQQLREQLVEIESMQKLLQEQAIKDPLTGLFNRRYLQETLQRELHRAERAGKPLSVVMMDLDHFKKINDTYGHASGDAVLQTLGAVLLQKSRAGDIACRYGGEEFVIILIDTPVDIALQRAEQWRAEFSSLRFSFNGIEVKATLSAGVAAFPDHGHDEATLFHAADNALYAAKAAGRNNVQLAVTDRAAA